MRRIFMLVLALAISGPAAAQVHKCEINGQTTYQSAPCPAGAAQEMGGGRLSVHDAPNISHIAPYRPPERPRRSASTSSSDGYTSSLERRNAEVRARARGQVLVGMSEHQVTSILGRPDEVDTQASSLGTCKLMYWWDDHEITDYVRVCNGAVNYARQ